MARLVINKLEDAIHVVKENHTIVDYFIFNEYEIHLNTLPPRSIQEWHYHKMIEEVILVTKGHLKLSWIEDEVELHQILNVGEIVQVKDSIHTFSNEDDCDVEFIVFRLVLDGNDKRALIKNDKVIIKR